MEAGKRRLAGAANTDEVKGLHREARDSIEVVAEQVLELRLLQKSMFMVGATTNEISVSRQAIWQSQICREGGIGEVGDHPTG